MNAQRQRAVSCVNLLGGVTLEICCNTVVNGWGRPCDESPKKTGGKLRYFSWWGDIRKLLQHCGEGLGKPLR